MIKFDLNELNLDSLKVIRDKYNRIDERGVNQGRVIYFDPTKNIYYKIFHKDYCRLDNFINAYNNNFFDGITPGLMGLIYNGDDIIGYAALSGEVLSNSEFDIHFIPNEFTEKLLNKIKETKMFFMTLFHQI